ncbi:MAG: AraC family transcriptional regulator [Christensenellales bacterium]|jgi:hypothetical protein
MKVSEFAGLCGGKLLTEAGAGNEISCGYTCDLLSHVMASGREGMAWITVQTHMNVVAVASLHDLACVIIPEGIAVDQLILSKAEEEGVAVVSSGKTAYELAALMSGAGIAPAVQTPAE